MSKSTALKRAFTEWYSQGPAFMITLTFNWGDVVRRDAARTRLREFSRRLDRQRLGGRFYEFEAEHRTMFSVVPEKFDGGYPHFHGLIRVPDDRRARFSPPNYQQFIQDCWKDVTPSGTVKVEPLRDEGAMFYATKETALNSDDAVHSFDFWAS